MPGIGQELPAPPSVGGATAVLPAMKVVELGKVAFDSPTIGIVHEQPKQPAHDYALRMRSGRLASCQSRRCSTRVASIADRP
jgi:hypothetical protein